MRDTSRATLATIALHENDVSKSGNEKLLEYLYGFGRIQYLRHDDDPCYPISNAFYRDLVYARIDTEQHGSLFSVGETEDLLPTSFSLSQNYPNPFNLVTVIHYSLPRQEHVVLKLFDILGRELLTLLDAVEVEGSKSFTPDASALSSGAYFYRLQTRNYIETRKLLLLR